MQTESHSHPGVRRVVSGMQVWENGTPNRPYVVLTTVRKRAANQAVGREDQVREIVARARSHGADAVVVLDSVLVNTGERTPNEGRFIMAPQTEAQLIKYR